MARFNAAKKGYSIAEVDSFVDNLELYNKRITAEQAIRIEEQRAEIAALNEQLTNYKQREESVAKALTMAVDKAKESDYASKIRYALEGERIKMFRSKWENYCKKYIDNLAVRESKQSVFKFLTRMDGEISEAMNSELNIPFDTELSDEKQQYLDETSRLEDGLSEKDAGLIDKVKKLAKDSSKFNLDDINNPPDLEEICRSLGI